LAALLERAGALIHLLDRVALRASLGLGGRPRRAGDPVERARKSVYNRIRTASARIERDLPVLARHLRTCVRTGTTCCYAPDRSLAWRGGALAERASRARAAPPRRRAPAPP